MDRVFGILTLGRAASARELLPFDDPELLPVVETGNEELTAAFSHTLRQTHTRAQTDGWAVAWTDRETDNLKTQLITHTHTHTHTNTHTHTHTHRGD